MSAELRSAVYTVLEGFTLPADARKILEAAYWATPAPGAPAGFKLVPVEPTDAMRLAGGHVNSEWLNDNAPIGEARYVMPMAGVYRAMLNAAPGAPGQEAAAVDKDSLTTQAAAVAQETDRDWSKAQDWKGMDGATAFLLINRHSDGWGDVGAMMNAWLAANAAEDSDWETP